MPNAILEKKDTNAGILLTCSDDDDSQGYSKIKEAFRALTEDAVFKTVIFEGETRSSSEVIGLGYNLFLFDKKY